ncbi:MAG: hypothetical protein VZR00_05470 [Lachnospiraceae bacterium]|jgi:hypothetical protein|nr:hypothetical protein [Lachnospiraceae bacterium]MEE3461327.1 hypothetical protein [Lachnospiraceae bacterium]
MIHTSMKSRNKGSGNLRVEISKMLLNPMFIIEVLVIIVMFLSANITIGMDMRSPAWAMYQYMNGNIAADELYGADAFSAFIYGWGSWFTLFIPVVSSFCTIPLLCDERNGGMTRFILIRQKKRTYILGKFLGAFICGGMAVIAAGLIYLVLCFSILPLPDEGILSMLPMVYGSESMYKVIAFKLFLGFIYGGFQALFAIMFSSWLKNRYLIICLPFLLKYCYDQVITLIGSSFIMSDAHPMADSQSADISEIIWRLSSNGIMNIKLSDSSFINLLPVIITAVVTIALFLLYRTGLNHRKDFARP